MSKSTAQVTGFRGRRLFVLATFGLGMSVLVARGFYLQVLDHAYLSKEGDSRQQRVVALSAHRGPILDRKGEAIAISTPVDTVWANPSELIEARGRLSELARLLEMDEESLIQKITRRADKEFVYIKRHVTPAVAEKVKRLGLPGVSLQREYRRFYPRGEVMAHVLGFTNIDDQGQEGLELAYDEWLDGEPGLKRVLRDRLGRVVDDIELISAPEPGNELQLTIDSRIQYLAYRELKLAIKEHKARSGSVVVIRPGTGEILAMVNQPSFNPNNRKGLKPATYRNRAITDVFEPGSAIKPFIVAAALESGNYQAGSIINTAPGYFKVRGHKISDTRNHGWMDLGRILSKSSNVGASKLALDLPSELIWSVLDGVGFGRVTGTGFPGESAGLLADFTRWREVEKATLAFGYGISVTPLQLAEAYSVIAAGGIYHPATFVARNESDASQVFSRETALSVRKMLRRVVHKEGSAPLAAIDGYTVAGKTGTARKSIAGGYAEDRYLAVFAGMVPALNPELVAVVMINEPSAGEYYGGAVAAPVFSRVMSGALRYLDVAPDDFSRFNSASGDRGDQNV
jgi:cell division protein FtsI (penicillin-binding protein 3)